MDLVRPTIVCIHGLLGFDVLAVGSIPLTRYFRYLIPWFRNRGYKVLTPALPPIGSIERRAQVLRRYLLEQCPNEKLVMIAHSMGGLDSRYLLTHLGDSLAVASLFTLVTPHRGSPVAESILSASEKYKLIPLLERTGLDLGGLRDLRPSSCEQFNRDTPNRNDVRYYSIVAHRSPDQIRMTLRFACDHIYKIAGSNDGLVPTTSAMWGECLGELTLDHMEILGHGRLGSVNRELKSALHRMMETIESTIVKDFTL